MSLRFNSRAIAVFKTGGEIVIIVDDENRAE